jgi:hypothetical protein
MLSLIVCFTENNLFSVWESVASSCSWNIISNDSSYLDITPFLKCFLNTVNVSSRASSVTADGEFDRFIGFLFTSKSDGSIGIHSQSYMLPARSYMSGSAPFLMPISSHHSLVCNQSDGFMFFSVRLQIYFSIQVFFNTVFLPCDKLTCHICKSHD